MEIENLEVLIRGYHEVLAMQDDIVAVPAVYNSSARLCEHWYVRWGKLFEPDGCFRILFAVGLEQRWESGA